jgi:CheY-like chemotaxis protein
MTLDAARPLADNGFSQGEGKETAVMLGPAQVLTSKVLVVDDQLTNVRLLERTLRSAGYVSVATTQNPHEVCELHRKDRYDLILLDLQMPGMDGFRVLEGLKQVDASLSVLVMSAHAGNQERALQAGAKGFISKPFNAVELLARVYSLLESRLSASSPPAPNVG